MNRRAKRTAGAAFASGTYFHSGHVLDEFVNPPSPPPRRLRLDRETRAIAKTIGIRLDGNVRTDVIAYDVDAGWIEVRGDLRLDGKVEPYWRHAAPPVAVRTADDHTRAIDAAAAKRARKAAKIARRAA